MSASLALSSEVIAAVFAEAVAAWPREACGVILGDLENAATQQFHRFENLADRYHALDPERYPRDGRTAYAMDPLKLERLVDTSQARGLALLAIVHSHPQHASYFSATDRAAAAPFGLPTYAGAAQIVVSVFEAEVRDCKAFAWDGLAEVWSERELSGLPRLPGPPAGAPLSGDV